MKTKMILLFAGIVILSAFQTTDLKSSKIQKGMIKVSVFYPTGEGKTFNWEYYTSKHVPMVKSLLGNAVKSITIDKGISGRTSDSPATYVAMFHMYFESVAAYQSAFGPNADKIRSDIPNYTNIQPVVQISEVQE